MKLINKLFRKEKQNYIRHEEKHKPIVYEIYNYLKDNCVGYERREKSGEIMAKFEIHDNKLFRAYIQDIRDSGTLQKIVCSEAGLDGGYWIATNDKEVYTTLRHIYKRSMKMLHTYSKMKNKLAHNNQYRLKLSQYEKELYQSIMQIKK